MSRDEVALAIFIKRMPPERLVDENRKYFEGLVGEAYELAQLFLDKRQDVKIEDVE